MNPTLTVAYITARERCEIGWTFDSLTNEGFNGPIIVIDLFAELDGRKEKFRELAGRDIVHVECKPNTWGGKYRLTKENWWHKSPALNTAICLCKTDWIAFIDDRAVILPGYLNCIKEAMATPYAVFGSYQKRTGLIVTNGVITHSGIIIGEDARQEYIARHRNSEAPSKCPGQWSYGANLALPLEWVLCVNGFAEDLNGLGMEDVIFGSMLANNSFDTRYDFRMKIIEDRTPSELGAPMLRSSKEKHPNDVNDKGHEALRRFATLERAPHYPDIRVLREKSQNGFPFEVPTLPSTDWFDGKPLSEL